MNPFSWLRRKLVGSKAQRRAAAAPNTRPRSWDRYMLQLETLESRLAPAQITYVWTDADHNGSWHDGNNWTNGGPETVGVGNTAILQFNSGTVGAADKVMTDDLVNTNTFDEIHFTATGGPSATGYTINGPNTININAAGGIVVDAGVGTVGGGATETFAANITINQTAASNITNNDVNTLVAVKGPVTLGGFNLALTGTGFASSFLPGQSVAINGVVSGAGGLTTNGLVTLAGANTYTATTTVDSGALNVTNSSGLGNAANITTNNSAIVLDGVSVTQGNLILNNNAELYTAGVNGAAGGTSTYNGLLTLPAAGIEFLGSVANSSNLNINGNITGGAANNNTLSIITFNPATVAGVVDFQQNNTYFGITEVGFGGAFGEILQIDAPGGLGAGGAGNDTQVNNGSELLLKFSSGNNLAANAGTGAGENLSLAGAGPNGLGALQVNGASSLGVPGTITLTADATIGVGTGTLTLPASAVISGAHNLTYDEDVATAGSQGKIITAAPNTYNGTTDIKSGVALNIQNNASLGAAVVANTVTIEDGAALETQGNLGTIVNNLQFNTAAPADFPSVAGALGSLDDVSGKTTFSGTVTMNNPVAAQTTISVDTAGAANELELSGAIQGPGAVAGSGGGIVKAGVTGGILLLDGAAANTFGGQTNVNDGILELAKAGVFAISGPLVIGDAALDTVANPIAVGSDVVQVDSSNQIATAATITIKADGDLFLNGAAVQQTVGTFSMTGGEVTGPGTLSLTSGLTATGFHDAANAATYAALITGGNLALNLPFGVGATTTFLVTPTTGATVDHFDLQVNSVVQNDGGANTTARNILKTGTGTMGLLGANTYTGTTEVQGGALAAVNNQALGLGAAGVKVDPNATLALVNGTDIAGKPLALNGPGFADPITGVLSAALESWNGGTFDGPITLNGTGVNASSVGEGAGGTLTLPNVLSGADLNVLLGHVTMSGPTVNANAPNTYTGPTTVAAGATLELNKSWFNGIGVTPLVAVPGTLNINGTVQVDKGLQSGPTAGYEIAAGNPVNIGVAGDLKIINGSQQSIGLLSLIGGAPGAKVDLTSAAADQLLLTNGIAATGAGTANINGLGASPGQLTLSNSGENFNVASGTTLNLNVGMNSAANGPTIVGADTTATTIFAGTAPNTQGNTTLNSGLLLLNKNAASAGAPAAIGNGQTLTIGGVSSTPGSAIVREAGPNSGAANWQLGGVTSGGANVVVNADGVLDLNGHTDRIASVAAGGTALTMTGGSVALGAGTLFLDGNVVASGAPVISGTGGVLNLDGATRTFDVAANGVLTVSTVIANGGLTKVDSGRLVFTANNTYAGTTTVSGGVLVVDGSQPQSIVNVNSGATIAGNGTVGSITTAPGSIAPGDSPGNAPGLLRVAGNVTFDSNSHDVVYINGTAAGTGYSQLNASGTVTLNGAALDLTIVGSLPQNASFDIVHGNSVVGTFSNAANGQIITDGSGHTVKVTYTPTDVILTLIANPAPVATNVVGGPAISGFVEGQSNTAALANFTDPSGDTTAGNFSATITWGDGSTSAGTISGPVAGVYTVSGTHTYGEETPAGTPNTITVVVHHVNTGDSNTVTDTATVSDPNVAVTGGFSFTAVEGAGSTQQAVAQFTDPGGAEPNSFDPTGSIASHYTATINWGDNSPDTTGIITVSGGIFTVSGSHTYVEEGNFNIITTVTHEGTQAQTVSFGNASTVNVSDPNIAPTGGYAITAVEGAASPSQTVAAFTDPGGAETPDKYSATINWGDNSATSAGTIAVANGSTFTVAGTHTYAEEGSYTVTVTISHEGSQAQVVTSTANVSDPNVIATGGQTITAAEGTASTSQTVATFTDPGGAEDPSKYAASINWGDNTTATVGVITSTGGNTFSVAGSHTYGEEGTYTVTVTINHESTTQQIVTTTATISDPAVAPTGGFAISAVEGASSGVQTVATFTDPAGVEPNSFAPAGTLNNYYSANIVWGDGQNSVGTLSLNAGVVSVSGAHTYAEEGTYTITVTISHEGTTAAPATSTATVSDPSVVASPVTITAAEGQVNNQPVATFTDPAGPEAVADYGATINWGDGSAPSAGTITVSGNTFTVSGSHTYTNEGPNTVSVTITHDTSAPVTVTSNTVVSDQPVVVTGGSAISVAEGTSTGTQTLATFTDPGGSEPAGSYTATINWGDGTPTTTGAITGPNAQGVYTVTGSHTFGEEGTDTVTVSVAHGTAGPGSGTVTATVSDPQVVWTSINPINATEGRAIGNFVLAGFIDPAGIEPNVNTPSGNVSTYYGATVDWGDGSTPSTAVMGTGANGLITVTGNHTYAEPGKYTVAITATHESAPSVSIKTTASVGDANLAIGVLSAPNNIAAGAQFSGLVTTFTDANPSAKASDFVVGLYWGDNSMTLGSVLLLGNNAAGDSVFGVYASKVYKNAGGYTLLVGVYDIDGAFVTTGTPTNGVQIYTSTKQADLNAYNANLYYAYQQKQSYDQQYSTQHLGYQQFLSNYWQGQFNYYLNLYNQRESQP